MSMQIRNDNGKNILVNPFNFLFTQDTNYVNPRIFVTKSISKERLPTKNLIMSLIYNDNFLSQNPLSGHQNSAYTNYVMEIRNIWELAHRQQPEIENFFSNLYYDFKWHPLGLSERFITRDENMVFRPDTKMFKFMHNDALDIFFKDVQYDGVWEIGPEITSVSSGIVMAIGENWQGGPTKESYRGGGLSPKAGNGVIIYNPEDKRYYYYAHLYRVTVEPGDILTPGTVIGRGGNTGMNACQKKHGRHLHFEIYDAHQKRKLNIYELYQLLFAENN